jgi:hypothetical protein
MTRSVRDEGLPSWLLTRRMAVASGIAVATLFIAVMTATANVQNWWTDFNQEAPSCYLHQGTPLIIRNANFRESNYDAVAVAANQKKVLGSAKEATAACTPGRCPRAAAEAYRQAIRTYVRERSFDVAIMYRTYGDAGLGFAMRTYGTTEDDELINVFRERQAQGLVDPSSMGQFAPQARMLLYRSIADFKPCLKS